MNEDSFCNKKIITSQENSQILPVGTIMIIDGITKKRLKSQLVELIFGATSSKTNMSAYKGLHAREVNADLRKAALYYFNNSLYLGNKMPRAGNTEGPPPTHFTRHNNSLGYRVLAPDAFRIRIIYENCFRFA